MTQTPQPPASPHGPQPGAQPPQYPGTQIPPATPRKPWFKRWWVWAIAAVVLVGAVNAVGGGTTSDQNQPASAGTSGASETSTDSTTASTDSETSATVEEPTEPLTLDDGWTMDDSDGFAVYVEGYVTNNTDEAVTSYVQITFDALDADGANLGTCIDNTNTIDAGGRWKFKAICLDSSDEIAKVRFKDITGF